MVYPRAKQVIHKLIMEKLLEISSVGHWLGQFFILASAAVISLHLSIIYEKSVDNFTKSKILVCQMKIKTKNTFLDEVEIEKVSQWRTSATSWNAMISKRTMYIRVASWKDPHLPTRHIFGLRKGCMTRWSVVNAPAAHPIQAVAAEDQWTHPCGKGH